jgi:hypothetical protein
MALCLLFALQGGIGGPERDVIAQIESGRDRRVLMEPPREFVEDGMM